MEIRGAIQNASKEKYIQILTLLLIFFAGMNFLNMYAYFLLIGTGVFILIRKKLSIDTNVILLLILALSWIFFSTESKNVSATAMIKPFLYFLAYLVGRNFSSVTNEASSLTKNEKLFRASVLVAAGGLYAHYILNFALNFNFTGRNSTDIWTRLPASATGQAAMASMMLAVAVAFVVSSKKKLVKAVFITVIISILMYNLVLSGRTLLIITAITLLLCIIYSIKEAPDSRSKFKILFTVLAVILVCVLLIGFNAFGIQDYLAKSNLFLRFTTTDVSGMTDISVLDDSRSDRKIFYLQNIEKSFFGGRHIYNMGIGYAHDLYLDTYDEAGIFALIAVIAFSLKAIFSAVRCIINKRLELSTRLILLSLYVTMMIIFFIEPILNGMMWLFAMFCFIHGFFIQLDNASRF